MKKKLDAILKYIRESDMLLLALCLFSSIYGIILISSTTRNMSENSNVYTQVISLIIGVGLYVLFSILDIETIADKSKILYVMSILFISTLFIWGYESSGNRAWLRFGSFGIQPAEVVKIPYTIILAKMISDYKERRTLNAPISLLKIIAVFSVMFIFIIVSSQDLGSALVYVFILVIMLFVGGIDLKWMLLGFGVVTAALPLAWKFALSEIQKNRILAPYYPATIDPSGRGVTWQPNQSRMAIASGDFSGQGLYSGHMTQSGAVPMQHTDFIFSVAGEELGFIGSFLIIALLLAIITRCIHVGIKSNNTIGMLVCTGLAAMLIVQTFENIGMCLGLTPVIGLTLPFFSYGGSSLITMFAAMGIVSGIKMRPKPMRTRNYGR
ncbi:MAG: FtsW/RodA/SpoVE family cell cycle protein [Clostridiales bacterium]|nr:FtsW/RodA/SpoVE family cell cycle protein [Clostridiales bacterium]